MFSSRHCACLIIGYGQRVQVSEMQGCSEWAMGSVVWEMEPPYTAAAYLNSDAAKRCYFDPRETVKNVPNESENAPSLVMLVSTA